MSVDRLRILSWNLYHGRAVPPAGRSLLEEFASVLAAWEWDVAMLQEVPPWWVAPLADRAGAQHRRALTSRNWLPPVQRWLGDRFPDLLKSGGGGANALLVRGAISDHRRALLRRWPERRVVHGVRLAGGIWVANLHATAHHPARAVADVELARLAALAWAGDAPLVIGGDLNLRTPRLPGFVAVSASKVDHVLARGLEPAGPAEMPARGGLSDHAPVAVTLWPAARR